MIRSNKEKEIKKKILTGTILSKDHKQNFLQFFFELLLLRADTAHSMAKANTAINPCRLICLQGVTR